MDESKKIQEWEPLIKALASSWASSSIIGLEFDDRVQEGYIAVAKALPKYDTTRGAALSTFLRRVIKNAFINQDRRFRKPEYSFTETETDEQNIPDGNGQIEKVDTLLNTLKGKVSPDAEQILTACFNPPQALIQIDNITDLDVMKALDMTSWNYYNAKRELKWTLEGKI